jgi:coronin-7
VCHGYDSPAKFNQRAPTLQVASRAITDFDVSRFDDLVAAGTDDGKVCSSVLVKKAQDS